MMQSEINSNPKVVKNLNVMYLILRYIVQALPNPCVWVRRGGETTLLSFTNLKCFDCAAHHWPCWSICFSTGVKIEGLDISTYTENKNRIF